MPPRNLPALIHDPDLGDNPENRAPDCVSMDLSGTQVDDSTIKVQLSIQFGEQEFLLNWPRLSFAVNGGEIRLALEGAAFHHPDDTPGQMPLSVAKKMTAQSTNEVNQTHKKAAKLGCKATGEADLNANWETEIQRGRKAAHGETNETSYIISQVQPLLSTRPGWRFTNRTNGAFLEGTLINQLCGTCDLTGGEFSITATFHIRDRDVVLQAAEVFDFNPLTSSLMKMKLARRLIFNRLIKPKSDPYLCRVALRYE